MGLEDADLLDDGDAAGGGGGKAAVAVSCSICLEDVTDIGDRSWARLICGHQFHLDCIGSAFNVKGMMQCPNCRKVEKGQWLYADGGRLYPEINIDDLVNDEDLYDLSYSESSMWCPFGGFTRLATSYDEREFPTTGYLDLLGQHAIFTEHAPVSSAAHLCPYIAYVQPLHPSSSASNASVSDVSNYNNHWNGQSAASEVPNSYAFPTMDVHYHTLFPSSSSRIGGVDQPSMPSIMPRRPARTSADMPRSGSYSHPFVVGQSSATRAPGAVSSTMVHPYPGSAARARERSQALQAYFQQPSNLPAMHIPLTSATRRPNSQVQVGQVATPPDQTHPGVYFFPTSTARSIQEAENSTLNAFHQRERDPLSYPVDRERGWGPFHQAGGFRQRHSSERNPSQSHYR